MCIKCLFKLAVPPTSCNEDLLVQYRRWASIINCKHIQNDRIHKVEKHSSPRLRRATKKATILLGSILFLARTRCLRVKAWFGMPENMDANILLVLPLIDRCIRKIFSAERKNVPWPSGLVLILTNPATLARQSLSNAEPSRNIISPNYAVVRMARRVVLELFTKTRVMTSPTITRLFCLEPAHLSNQYQHLHIAPEIVGPARPQVFYILVSNFHTNALTYQKAR